MDPRGAESWERPQRETCRLRRRMRGVSGATDGRMDGRTALLPAPRPPHWAGRGPAEPGSHGLWPRARCRKPGSGWEAAHGQGTEGAGVGAGACVQRLRDTVYKSILYMDEELFFCIDLKRVPRGYLGRGPLSSFPRCLLDAVLTQSPPSPPRSRGGGGTFAFRENGIKH